MFAKDGDGAVQAVVLHRVGHEVEQYLLESLPVGEDVIIPAGMMLALELYRPLVGQRPYQSNGFAHDVTDEHGFGRECEVAALDPNTFDLGAERHSQEMVLAWERWHHQLSAVVWKRWYAVNRFPGRVAMKLTVTRDLHITAECVKRRSCLESMTSASADKRRRGINSSTCCRAIF